MLQQRAVRVQDAKLHDQQKDFDHGGALSQWLRMQQPLQRESIPAEFIAFDAVQVICR
jgi:hypothetical protein